MRSFGRRKTCLEHAYLFEQGIDATAYERQRDCNFLMFMKFLAAQNSESDSASLSPAARGSVRQQIAGAIVEPRSAVVHDGLKQEQPGLSWHPPQPLQRVL
jgi:hypothetical protein